MTWLHVIPRLPPPVCGVADYARCLARALEPHGMASVLVPARGAGDWRETLASAARAQEPALWLLHYSGYGYARRGAPLRLAGDLARLRKRHPSARLVTMFHELYATGAPLSSAFWVSFLQRHVASRLARLSDAVLTNRRASAQWLQPQLPPGGEIKVLPVFSNFGEEAAPAPPMQRPARLVLFGGGPARDAVFWRQTELAMSALGLGELVVVSHHLPVPESMSGRFAVRQTGVLEPEAMAEVLRECRCGVLDYNPDFLGKSGVLAAYAAFGVVPLLAQGRQVISEGLEEGRHFVSTQAVSAPTDLERVQQELRGWYAGHSQAATAAVYAKLAEGERRGNNVSCWNGGTAA